MGMYWNPRKDIRGSLMLRWLWDLLFTRSKWTVIKEIPVYDKAYPERPMHVMFILQDQNGNIKQKKIVGN